VFYKLKDMCFTNRKNRENKMIFETNSPEETFEIGKKLAKKTKPGEIVCLDGDLGVGKTVFTQGFAKGLGIIDNVNSPTFTIVQIYDEGRLPLYHFDVYRIGDPEEMYEIGYEDYFFGEGVCLIEWSKLIEELIPSDRIKVIIEKDISKGMDYRKITVEGRNEDIGD
jgi:tRNA threonylcarbamoyladenosine biosynthesis protein TsaE